MLLFEPGRQVLADGGYEDSELFEFLEHPADFRMCLVGIDSILIGNDQETSLFRAVDWVPNLFRCESRSRAPLLLTAMVIHRL